MPHITREAFVAQLERLQPLAESNPAAYRRRVQGWALLGYGFILLLLLGSVGLMGIVGWLTVVLGVGALAFKVLPALGFFLWKIGRSLLVKFDPPQGYTLSRAEAGPLLDLVQQQARALQAPAIHQVLLTSDYNAAAVQVPRLGALGWPRNYVVVGLPLLQTLSPTHAAAVVAHELGHLRGGHGRFGAWVYRVHYAWSQLVGQLEKSQQRSIFRHFTDWYVPHLNAWSHPLQRTAEFEADAAAARLTSAPAIAGALCVIAVRDSALDHLHWDVLLKQLAELPAPPTDAISRLLPVAKSAQLPATEEERLLTTAVGITPDPFDTHPTLGERLRALGQPASLPAPPTTTAAEAWFGTQLPQLAQTLDAQWAAERAEWWHERHGHLAKQRQRLHELEARRAAGETLPAEEAWQHADLTEDFVDAATALPLLRQLFDTPACEMVAKFAVGRILLGQDDPAGLPLLAEVVARDADFMGPSLALRQEYYQRLGDHAEAARLRTLHLQHADVMDEVLAERDGLVPSDTLLPHGLPAAALAAVRTLLATPAAGVSRAWLMRKELAHYAADKPFFVLLVLPTPGPHARTEPQKQAWVQQLANQLTMPGETLVVATGGAHAWLEKRAYDLEATEIMLW